MTPEEIKAEWVRRLRSGEYPQGKGLLHNNGKYCCWGVLCEIGVEQGILEKHMILGYRLVGDPFGPWNDKMPPSGFAHWSHMSHLYVGLAMWNDNGMSFQEIAEYIEGL